MPAFQQTYKNRAEAFEKFIEGQNLPVKRAKFYEDCKRLKMLQPDKSVSLAALLAYAREELEIDPVSGQSLVEKDQAQRKFDLEMRKLEAEVAAKENANRKEDARWMEVAEHEAQMGAFAGLIDEALRQQATLRLSSLIYLCGGDIRRDSEFARALEDLHAAALTDAVGQQTRTVSFEDEDA